MKKSSDAILRNSKKSLGGVTTTTDNSNKNTGSNLASSIKKLQSKNLYKMLYFVMYYWLALNDHFKLLFISKSNDVIFFIFTLFFVSK